MTRRRGVAEFSWHRHSCLCGFSPENHTGRNVCATTAAALILFSVAAFAQNFADVKIELLGRNWGYTEGPAWSKEGYLIFSDTPGDRLLKWVPGHDIEV